MASLINEPPQAYGSPEQQKGSGPTNQGSAASSVASWVMAKVNTWRAQRDTDNRTAWDEYYSVWRGQFTTKTRNSERSRIVTPALAEAVDLTHAQLTEAVFGRDRWFDLPDDVTDENKADMEQIRDLLDEDLNRAGVPDAIQKAIQIGCLFGNGIGKIAVEMVQEVELTPEGGQKIVEQPLISVFPLDVRELVVDPATDDIERMLGVAHETLVPMHEIKAKQRSKFYLESPVEAASPPDKFKPGTRGLGSAGTVDDAAYVTEWHGKLPKRLYMQFVLETGGEIEGEVPDTDDELVETITTVANFGTLLRCKLNPVWGQDRAIVAYQHESVPGEFWGRGVCEKGINPQRALDATVRMRLDAGALVAAPMVAADRSRLPRGFNYKVHPGKEWPTTGNPAEVVMGFNLGQINPELFAEVESLEAMVRQGTGAMDPGTALSNNSRRDTAAGAAMIAGGSVKRAKRTMYNIENQFLQPLLRKIVRRYVQFASDRYPQDIKFSVKGAMGIMAREYEQSMLSQLYMQTTPEEGPVRLMLLREIFNTSSAPNKTQMTKAIDAMLAPPDEQTKQKQQAIEQLNLRKLVAEVNKLENEALNQGAQAGEHAAKAQGVVLEASLKDDELVHDAARVQIEAVEAKNQTAQIAVSSEGNQLKRDALQLQREKLAHDKSKATKKAN